MSLLGGGCPSQASLQCQVNYLSPILPPPPLLAPSHPSCTCLSLPPILYLPLCPWDFPQIELHVVASYVARASFILFFFFMFRRYGKQRVELKGREEESEENGGGEGGAGGGGGSVFFFVCFHWY